MYQKLDAKPPLPISVVAPSARIFVLAGRYLKTLVILVVIAAVGIFKFVWWNKRESASEYTTDKISRGSVELTVAATVTVQAVTTVQVGSQVLGTIIGWVLTANRASGVGKLSPSSIRHVSISQF